MTYDGREHYVFFGFDDETAASKALTTLHEAGLMLKQGMFVSVRGDIDTIQRWVTEEKREAKRHTKPPPLPPPPSMQELLDRKSPTSDPSTQRISQ